LQIVRPTGTSGTGVTVHQDASVYVAGLDPEAEVEHVFGEGRGGYFYLVTGAVELNGERLATGDAAKVLDAGRLAVRALETSELIFVDTVL
jgi:redox-sensitive bicupin YhaK (pirin superfamily)